MTENHMRHSSEMLRKIHKNLCKFDSALKKSTSKIDAKFNHDSFKKRQKNLPKNYHQIERIGIKKS